MKALLEEEETALPLQSEDKDGRKISSRIEAATNSEEEDRSDGVIDVNSIQLQDTANILSF